MKKILLFIILFSPWVMHAQDTHFTGSGTKAVPYSGGTLGGTSHHDESWSGTIYVSGDLTIGNYGHLTIDPGTTIKFTTAGADLIITGTGQLSADGSSGSQITFTADYDDDGHEAGETWGHISFEGSTGTSTIQYSTIEYGSKTGSGIEGYGGGIHANTSNLTISNSIIRYNTAIYGGGIFINKNQSTPVSNCLITNNSTAYAGGGLYCWDGCSSIISNCIFSNNSVTASYRTYLTGGGLAAISNTTIQVINCTFVNNTSNATNGKSLIYYGNTPFPSVKNSIFWGSSEQIYLVGPSSTVIQYCAVQGVLYPNGINLSSGNGDFTGPNFIATDGSNWSIKVISPCLNAGTTPSPTIPYDYAGNSRVGAYDIGAYEVQYNGWKTTASSSTWSEGNNWDLGHQPTSSENVVIPVATNYPITSSFTIPSGYGMVLEPGAKATITSLTTSGDLKLRSDASNISSLITNSGVTAIIEIYLSGGGSPNYKWHYLSSPVSSIDTLVFTSLTKNLVQFVESRPTSDLSEGWVACDGYVYSTGIKNGPTFASLTSGKGYNYYDATNNTFTFSGSLNTSNAVMSLGYSGSPSLNGFNLLGNPFSSGLDWDDIANGVYFTYPSSTSKGVYFTRDNSQCTYISGVGTPGDVTGTIPPMQGFFTKTYSTGNSITLPAAARTHDTIHARYKGKGTIPLVRLAIFEDTESADETVIRFDELAKTDLDNDFDALKMFLSASKTTIHSKIGETDYAINGQPFPESFVEIPVVINLISTGNHKISAIQLQGLEDYTVTLTDNSTGFIADLKTMPDLTFPSPAGLITDRFVLKITNIATAIEITVTTENNFNIYHGYGLINIQTLADDWEGKMGSVKVLDLAGKTIADLYNTQFTKNSVIQVQAPDAKGLYIVEIKSGVKRHVGKVIIR